MKKLLLLAAMTFPLFASAQTKKPAASNKSTVVHKPAPLVRQSPGLEGIGLFKIGITDTVDLKEFAKSKGTFIGVMDDDDTPYTPSDETKIALVMPNTDNDYTLHSTLCPGAQVYYLSSYDVAGIRLSDIYLKFYHNKLVDFHCEYSSELVEALTLKYGKPKTEIQEKLRHCVFVHTGNKITYKDITTRDSWDNGFIHATSTLMKWYDGNCEEHFTSYFNISDAPKSNLLFECNRIQERIKGQQSEKNKRKNLSDL